MGLCGESGISNIYKRLWLVGPRVGGGWAGGLSAKDGGALGATATVAEAPHVHAGLPGDYNAGAGEGVKTGSGSIASLLNAER